MTSKNPESKGSPASFADFNDPPPAGPLRTVVQFFAIPLLIVTVSVGLFVGISSFLETGPKSAMEYVKLLRSDTINRRWHAAMEISARLGSVGSGDVPAEFRDPELVNALVLALEQAREQPEDPPRVAIHLLRILYRLRDPRTLDALRAAADDEHPWIRSHAVLALGGMRDLASIEIIERHLTNDDDETRKVALHALAVIDYDQQQKRHSARTVAAARRFLGDRYPYARFQAALILAQAGETEGVLPVLAKMLDRSYLRGLPFHGDLYDVDRSVMNSNLLLPTIFAVGSMPAAGKDPRILGALKRLTDDSIEGDPQIRQQARIALGKLEEPATE